MLTIRLTRVGKKKDASFRVVVVEKARKVKAGNYLEMVGSYDPRVDKVELKSERIKHWIKMGATVSDTVHNLLISNKIIEGKKINVLPKKTVTKKEEVSASEVEPSDSPSDRGRSSTDSTSEALAEAPVENEVAAETPTDTITE